MPLLILAVILFVIADIFIRYFGRKYKENSIKKRPRSCLTRKFKPGFYQEKQKH